MSYFEARSFCSRLDRPWSVDRVIAYAQPEKPFYLTSEAAVSQRLWEKTSVWLSGFFVDGYSHPQHGTSKQSAKTTPCLVRHFGESLKQSVLSQHVAMCNFAPLDFSPTCFELLSPDHPRRQMLEKLDAVKTNGGQSAAHHRLMGAMLRANVGLLLSMLVGFGMRLLATVAWQVCFFPKTLYDALTKPTANLVPKLVVRDPMRGLSMQPPRQEKDARSERNSKGDLSSERSCSLFPPRPRRNASAENDMMRPQPSRWLAEMDVLDEMIQKPAPIAILA